MYLCIIILIQNYFNKENNSEMQQKGPLNCLYFDLFFYGPLCLRKCAMLEKKVLKDVLMSLASVQESRYI